MTFAAIETNGEQLVDHYDGGTGLPLWEVQFVGDFRAKALTYAGPIGKLGSLRIAAKTADQAIEIGKAWKKTLWSRGDEIIRPGDVR